MLSGYEVSIDDKNVDKIMRWPFLLTSWIMSINSASVGFCPKDRMTVPSSLVVMVPEKRNKNKGLTSVSRHKNQPSESHAKNATSTVLISNAAFPKNGQRPACLKRTIPCTRDIRQHFSRHCRPMFQLARQSFSRDSLWCTDHGQSDNAPGIAPTQTAQRHCIDSPPLTIAILVKEGEGLFELSNLLFSKLIGHFVD